jgi:two-component system OmpR family response regulator
MGRMTATLPAPGRTPARILIVEDEETLAEVVSMALRLEGWEVRSTFDGATAVDDASGFSPDVIVLDIMLPHVDGVTVVRRLREEHDETPVLFLTARDELDDRIAAYTAGGDDYLTKPFSLETVVDHVRQLLLTRGHLTENASTATLAAAAALSREPDGG